MLTLNKILTLIDTARRRLGHDDKSFAHRAGITEDRWRQLKSNRRKLNLEELPQIAHAADLSVELVGKHHVPFLALTPEEARAILQLSLHVKRNGPKLPAIFVQAVEKLESELKKIDKNR